MRIVLAVSMRLSPGHHHPVFYWRTQWGPPFCYFKRDIHLRQLSDFSLKNISSSTVPHRPRTAQQRVLLSQSPSSCSSTTYSRHKLEKEFRRLLPQTTPPVSLVSSVCILAVFQPLLRSCVLTPHQTTHRQGCPPAQAHPQPAPFSSTWSQADRGSSQAPTTSPSVHVIRGREEREYGEKDLHFFLDSCRSCWSVAPPVFLRFRTYLRGLMETT
jgi:hypothetical protein